MNLNLSFFSNFILIFNLKKCVNHQFNKKQYKLKRSKRLRKLLNFVTKTNM